MAYITSHRLPVLLVDDEPPLLRSASVLLRVGNRRRADPGRQPRGVAAAGGAVGRRPGARSDQEALRRADGNQGVAAGMLGLVAPGVEPAARAAQGTRFIRRRERLTAARFNDEHPAITGVGGQSTLVARRTPRSGALPGFTSTILELPK